MPGSVIAETSRPGQILQFTEDDHRYVIKDKRSGNEVKELVSCTTFIGRYFPPFDPDGSMCAKCAAKKGITAEAMRAEWDKNRDEAAAYGTRVHEYMEDLLKERKPRNTPENEKERIVFELGAKFVKSLKPRIECIQPEKIICDADLGLAGTIDLLAKDPHADQLIMIDWKTNKKIEMDTFFNRYAYPPISHIPDCEFGHYQLQLNLYEYMLKHAGYIPWSMPVVKYLVHLHMEKGLTTIKVPDKRREIEMLLEDDRSKQQVNG